MHIKIGDTVAINHGIGCVSDIAIIGNDEWLIVRVSGGLFWRTRDEVVAA